MLIFTSNFCRYHMEKEGKICRLIIKVCRPDDECEYACGVDERRTRARLFVEGLLPNSVSCHRKTNINLSNIDNGSVCVF